MSKKSIIIRALSGKNYNVPDFLSHRIEKDLGVRALRDHIDSAEECIFREEDGALTIYVLSPESVGSVDVAKFSSMILSCTNDSESNMLLAFPIEYENSTDVANQQIAEVTQMLVGAGARVFSSISDLIDSLGHKIKDDPFLSLHGELYAVLDKIENLLHNPSFLNAVDSKEEDAIHKRVEKLKNDISLFEQGKITEGEVLGIIDRGNMYHAYFSNILDSSQGVFSDIDSRNIKPLPPEMSGGIYYPENKDMVTGVLPDMKHRAEKRESIEKKFTVAKALRKALSGAPVVIGDYLVKSTVVGEDLRTAVNVGMHIYRAGDAIADVTDKNAPLAPISMQEASILFSKSALSVELGTDFLKEVIEKSAGKGVAPSTQTKVAAPLGP